MADTRNTGREYIQEGTETKTEGGSFTKVTEAGRNLADSTAGIIKDTPFPKLFTILTLGVFGVLAFSKGTNGLTDTDIAIYILFLIFLILASALIHIIAFIYEKASIKENYSLKPFERMYKILTQNWPQIIFFILTALFVAIYILNRANILNKIKSLVVIYTNAQ